MKRLSALRIDAGLRAAKRAPCIEFGLCITRRSNYTVGSPAERASIPDTRQTAALHASAAEKPSSGSHRFSRYRAQRRVRAAFPFRICPREFGFLGKAGGEGRRWIDRGELLRRG